MHHQHERGDFSPYPGLGKLSVLAAVIGAFSAGVAWVLLKLIQLFTNVFFYGEANFLERSPAANHLGLWVIVIPVVGSVIIGLMARYGSDKIRGHGIPEALEAILFNKSLMQPKVALLKPLSSAISIGSGGPFGAEGPIIMTGGAFGSILSQAFHLTSAERKTLLVAGAAAGMSAVFSTPLAAVLLAVELLLFEWRPRSLVPVAIASVTAAGIRPLILGSGPLFAMQTHTAPGLAILACAAGVGLIAGIFSGIMSGSLYKLEDLFGKLPIHWMWWPALGGLVVGLGGYFKPRVLGVGYDVIGDLLQNRIALGSVLGLVSVKAIVWLFALASGTSGGVLAPLLIMGAALGSVEATVLPVGSPELWALVSMSAVLGGMMGAPFTACLFALELTHDVTVLPALLAASIAGYAFSVLYLKRSILTEKVARRGYDIYREYSVDPLERVRVEEAMAPDDRRLAEAPAHSVYPRESCRMAADRMAQHGLVSLPVVSRADSRRLVGTVTVNDLLKARLRSVEEETSRERYLMKVKA